jgi:hypothetical protein
MPVWGWIGIVITISVIIGVCVYYKVNPILMVIEIVGEVIGDFFD